MNFQLFEHIESEKFGSNFSHVLKSELGYNLEFDSKKNPQVSSRKSFPLGKKSRTRAHCSVYMKQRATLLNQQTFDDFVLFSKAIYNVNHRFMNSLPDFPIHIPSFSDELPFKT